MYLLCQVDSVFKEKILKFMDKYYIKFIFRNRLKFIGYCFLIFFFLILFRFFYIQILQNNYYSTQAYDNSIKVIPIEPARGLIFDRNNTIIADNKLNYSLFSKEWILTQKKKNRILQITCIKTS